MKNGLEMDSVLKDTYKSKINFIFCIFNVISNDLM